MKTKILAALITLATTTYTCDLTNLSPYKKAIASELKTQYPTIIAPHNYDSLFKQYPEAVPFKEYILQASEAHSVPPRIILAIIKAESRFNSKARSRVGARGLMQLMLPTARDVARDKKLKACELFDPELNIYLGTKYIRSHLDYFKEDIPLALASYNAGRGNVLKYGRKVPPFKETRKYVSKIMKALSDSPQVKS